MRSLFMLFVAGVCTIMAIVTHYGATKIQAVNPGTMQHADTLNTTVCYK